MIREAYEPARARQLRILMWAVLGLAAILFGWAGVIVLGHGDVALAVRVLVLPGALLAALAVVSLRALAADSTRAGLPLIATAVVTLLVALILSQTALGLLTGVVGVALLLFAVLPGRDEPAGPADG